MTPNDRGAVMITRRLLITLKGIIQLNVITLNIRYNILLLFYTENVDHTGMC